MLILKRNVVLINNKSDTSEATVISGGLHITNGRLQLEYCPSSLLLIYSTANYSQAQRKYCPSKHMAQKYLTSQSTRLESRVMSVWPRNS